MQNFILTENLRKGFRNTVVPINPESRFLTDTSSSALLTVVKLLCVLRCCLFITVIGQRPWKTED